MIVGTRSGDVQFDTRAQEWGSSHLIPQPGTAAQTSSGYVVTEEYAFGIPAVSNVIRSPCDIIASLPFMTYEEDPREKAKNHWLWHLLHEQPDEEGTGTYTFFWDLELSLEGYSNAFIQKAKTRNRVEGVRVLNPKRVRVFRDKDTNEKKFDVYMGPGQHRTFTAETIFHIRGSTMQPGADVGTSLLQQHRDAIGASLALHSFEGDYFKNAALSPFFFVGAKNQTEAQEILTHHNANHQGPGKQFKAGAVWGSIDVKSIPMSLEDAQYADAMRLSVEDACRIWRWPKELLELSGVTGSLPRDENAWTAKVMKFYVMPRLKRIERAFASDKDFYLNAGVIGEFLTAALERADFETRMRGYKDARQGGWVTANEIRDAENYPPREDGDTLLETPTGSAPNTVPAQGNRDNGVVHEGEVTVA